MIYLEEDFDHIKGSLYLAVWAWNEFKTKSDDIVIKLVEDFDHIKGSIYIAAKAWNKFKTKRDDAVN